jgi:hypothetical protein
MIAKENARETAIAGGYFGEWGQLEKLTHSRYQRLTIRLAYAGLQADAHRVSDESGHLKAVRQKSGQIRPTVSKKSWPFSGISG